MTEETDNGRCSDCLCESKHLNIMGVDFTALNDHQTCRSCRRDIVIQEDCADNLLSESRADDQQFEEKSTEENSMENSKIVFLAVKEDVSSKSVSSCEVPDDVKEETQQPFLNHSKGSICKATTPTGGTQKGEEVVEENNAMEESKPSYEGKSNVTSSSEVSNSNYTQCHEVTRSIPEGESDNSETVCKCHEVSRSIAEGASGNKETLRRLKYSETLSQSEGDHVTDDVVPDKQSLFPHKDELCDQKCPLVPEDTSRVPTLERLDRVHQDSLPSYSKNPEIAVKPETHLQDDDSHLVKEGIFVGPKQHREQIGDEPCLRADTESQTDQNLNHTEKVGSFETSPLLQKESNHGHLVQEQIDLQIDKNRHQGEQEESFENEEVPPEKNNDVRSETGAQVGDNLKDVETEGTSVNHQRLQEKNNNLPRINPSTVTLRKRKSVKSSVDIQNISTLKDKEAFGSSVNQEKNNNLSGIDSSSGILRKGKTDIQDTLKAVKTEVTSVNRKLLSEKNNISSRIDSPSGSSVDKQDIFVETETGEEYMTEVKFNVGKIRKRGIWYYSKKIMFDGIGWQVVVGRHAGDKVFIGLSPAVSEKERYLEYDVDYIIKLVNDQHGNRSVWKSRVHTFTLWGVQGLFEFLPWRELIDENSGFVDCDNFFRIEVLINVIYN